MNKENESHVVATLTSMKNIENAAQMNRFSIANAAFIALQLVESKNDQIESLQRENKRHSEMHAKMAERLCIRQDADGSVTDEIDRLQRANEELEQDAVPRSRYNAVCKEVDEWKRKYGDLTANATAEIDRLEAAAITPEMREKAEAALAEYVSWQRYSKCVEVVRDLLKETVEPTLEGEQ